MRINKFVAQASGLSRRAADTAVRQGRVAINGIQAQLGDVIGKADKVSLDGKPLRRQTTVTVMLNKPAGYVCSRNGQGSQTIYDLLPAEYHQLKPVGRLDKDSSGLLLLTNDGDHANELTHPRYVKQKVYEVKLNKELSSADKQQLETGVELDDGLSRLQLEPLQSGWQVTLSEGRNRQVRRSFAALGYAVTKLHRTQFGSYQLLQLKSGSCKVIPATEL